MNTICARVAAGDDKIFGRICDAVDIDLSRVIKSSMPRYDFDPVVLQQSFHAQPDFFAAVVFVLQNRLKIDLFNICLYSVSIACPDISKDFCRFQP